MVCQAHLYDITTLTSPVATRLCSDDRIPFQPPASSTPRLTERERLVGGTVTADVEIQAGVGGLYRAGDVEVLACRSRP